MLLMNKGDKVVRTIVDKNMLVFVPQLNDSIPRSIEHDMLLILVFTTNTTIASGYALIRTLVRSSLTSQLMSSQPKPAHILYNSAI